MALMCSLLEKAVEGGKKVTATVAGDVNAWKWGAGGPASVVWFAKLTGQSLVYVMVWLAQGVVDRIGIRIAIEVVVDAKKGRQN